MYDYSFSGILNQIGSFTTFGLIYLVGGGFLVGGVGAFYWGVRRAIVIGGLIVLGFFLYLSYQETGLTFSMFTNLATYFQGILYTMVGLVLGAVLSHLLFNINR